MDAGQLVAGLRLELSAFRRGLSEASSHARRFGRDFQNSFRDSGRQIDQVNSQLNRTGQNLRDLERIAGGIILSQAFYGMKTAISDAASELVSFMNDMEKAQIALEYFLETPKEAQSFLVQMNDFAAETAFNTTQALSLSRKLMAAQFNPNDIRGVMTILNDASAASGGTAEQMDRIVLALTQIKTNGKLAGQEMRQLAEAGIPIYKIIQEQLGLSGEQVMKAGKLGISGDKAVAAILAGLEKRYKGAADRIANTVPGMIDTIKDDMKILGSELFQAPYKAAEGGIRKIRDFLEKARDAMNEGGLGKVLENMFPPSLHASIRAIAGSIKSLGQSFIAFMKAMVPVIEVIGGGLTIAMSVILPVIAGVARAVAWLAQAAINTVPPLKYLLAAVTALLVAQVVAKVMILFWNVLRLGMIASVVAKAVMQLVAAMKALTLAMTRNPVIALVLVLAAALLHMTGATKMASRWLENLMDKLAALGGFDINKVLKPNDKDLIDVGEFESDMDKINDAFEDSTDKMEDDAKKLKKFLASFDEVFQVPEPEEDDKGLDFEIPKFDFDIPDIDQEITDKLPDEIELPEIIWPPLPWWAIRPINIRWNIEPINWPQFPKFPGPPPALVTAWETFLEGIRVRIKGLQVIFDGWKIPVIELPALQWQPIPIPNLKPVLNPVLEWLKEWAGQFGKAWEGVWDPIRQPVNIPIPNFGTALDGVLKELEQWGKQLQEKWGGLWQPSPKPILNFVPQILGALNPIPGAIAAISKAFEWFTQGGLASVGASIVGVFKDGWESAKQLGADMAKNWGASWESMGNAVSAFATWFSSGWSTVLEATGDIASTVGTFFADAAAAAWEGIKNGLSALGTWIADHWKQILAGIGIALVGALAIIFAPVTGAVAGAAGSVTAVVAAAIAIVGGALAVLAAVWDDGREAVINWAKGAGEAIDGWVTSVGDKLGEWGKNTREFFREWKEKAIETVIGWAKDTAKAIVDWSTETAKAVSGWASGVGQSFKDMWATGTEKVGDLTTKVKEGFKSWTEDAGTKVSAFKENFGKWMGELPGKMTAGIQSIPALFTGIMNKLPAPVKSALESGLTFFRNLPQNILTAITSIPSKFSSILDKLPKLVPQVITAMVKPFKDLPQKIWEAIKSIPEKIASVFSNIKLPSFSSGVEGVKSTFKAIGNITGFARGGIIDKDSIIRVGEGGRREAVVPMGNESAMAPFADAVASRLAGQLPPPGTRSSDDGDDRRPLYVGTLIADDKGIKELERKMRIVTEGENRRGGGRN